MSILNVSKFDDENFNTKLPGTESECNEPVPKVFIPNKSGHDFSASSRYGIPIYVTQGLINRFSVGYMARKWFLSLKDSGKQDYLLITSLTILTVVGAAIFGWLHGRINLLIFRNNKYIARTIIFENLSQEIEEDKKGGSLC